MKCGALLCFFLFGGVAALQAEGPAPQEEKLAPQGEKLALRAEFSVIALPNERALELVPQLRDAQKAEQAFAVMAEMIGKDQSMLVSRLNAMLRSGSRASVEEVEPVRVRKEDKGGGAAAEGGEFETRKVGVVVDVEPVLSPDRQSIEVNITASYVVMIQADEAAKESPRFDTHRVADRFITSSGQRQVLGSFPSAKRKGWTEIFIFRCEIQPPAGK